jgi:hypothetical protein
VSIAATRGSRHPHTQPGALPYVLTCPFCGAPETERLDVEGARFLVFRCMFTPRIEPELTDAEIAERLRAAAGSDARRFFQGTCDALHVYVTKGEGARFLTASSPRAGHGASGPAPGTT